MFHHFVDGTEASPRIISACIFDPSNFFHRMRRSPNPPVWRQCFRVVRKLSDSVTEKPSPVNGRGGLHPGRRSDSLSRSSCRILDAGGAGRGSGRSAPARRGLGPYGQKQIGQATIGLWRIGSAFPWGGKGSRFNSCQPDHEKHPLSADVFRFIKLKTPRGRHDLAKCHVGCRPDEGTTGSGGRDSENPDGCPEGVFPRSYR